MLDLISAHVKLIGRNNVLREVMSDRARPIRKEICLNETELNLIQHKMRQLGTRNFGAYARKMLIDGYSSNA